MIYPLNLGREYMHPFDRSPLANCSFAPTRHCCWRHDASATMPLIVICTPLRRHHHILVQITVCRQSGRWGCSPRYASCNVWRRQVIHDSLPYPRMLLPHQPASLHWQRSTSQARASEASREMAGANFLSTAPLVARAVAASSSISTPTPRHPHVRTPSLNLLVCLCRFHFSQDRDPWCADSSVLPGWRWGLGGCCSWRASAIPSETFHRHLRRDRHWFGTC